MTLLPASGTRRALCWLAAGLLGLLYLGAAAFNIAYGAMNVDEGFYAAATRAVWQGEMPYRDFGFTQTPLILYFNAPVLALTGFGLFEQRAVNGLWGALALLLAVRLVARRSGMGWTLLFVAIFTLLPVWMYFTHLGKTYGLTSLLVMGMTTVFLDLKPGGKKIALLTVLGVLGTASRLPAAPFFGVLWLAALWDGDRPSPRKLAGAGLLLITCSAAVFLPFYLAAPDQMVFWTTEIHRVAVANRGWRLGWKDLVSFAPAIWMVASLAIGGIVAQRQWRHRETFVIAAAALALAANLLPPGVYEEYGVPFLPPLAVASFLLLAPRLAAWSRRRSWLVAAVLLVTPLLLLPAINWAELKPVQRQVPSLWLPAKTRPYNYELPGNLRRATATVERLLPAGEPFIGPSIILAVEANRPIPRTLRMGAFTMTSDFETPEADRLHLATYRQFEKILRDIDVAIVGLHSQQVFNYAWSVPSFRYQTPEESNEWGHLLSRYFVLVHEDADFVVLARPHLVPLIAP